eukprot:m.236410 g.236410  ORF g.236410 m.236410 type:complete len:1103 (+) comp16048_c0_seq1:221-3529(+)
MAGLPGAVDFEVHLDDSDDDPLRCYEKEDATDVTINNDDVAHGKVVIRSSRTQAWIDGQESSLHDSTKKKSTQQEGEPQLVLSSQDRTNNTNPNEENKGEIKSLESLRGKRRIVVPSTDVQGEGGSLPGPARYSGWVGMEPMEHDMTSTVRIKEVKVEEETASAKTPHVRKVEVEPKEKAVPLSEALTHAGILLFNRYPDLGIWHLQIHSCLERDTDQVAKFLTETRGLSRLQIGNFLGDMHSKHGAAALASLLNNMDMAGTPLLDALRAFLRHMQLPADAGKNETLLQAFATAYYHANKDSIFKTRATTARMVSACILLNAELHGLKKKITGPEFCFQHKDIAGKDRSLPDKFMLEVYESIQSKPIRPLADHTDVVRAITSTITMLPSEIEDWVVPHRFFVNECDVTLVLDLETPTPKGKKKRRIVLFSDMLLISKRRKIGSEYRSFVQLRSVRCRVVSRELYRHCAILYHSLTGQTLQMFNFDTKDTLYDFASTINSLELQIDFETSAQTEVMDELCGPIPGDTGDGRLELFIFRCYTQVDMQTIERRVSRLDGVLSVIVNLDIGKTVIKYDEEILGPQRIMRFLRGMEYDCCLYADKPKDSDLFFPQLDPSITRLRQEQSDSKERNVLEKGNSFKAKEIEGDDSDDSDMYEETKEKQRLDCKDEEDDSDTYVEEKENKDYPADNSGSDSDEYSVGSLIKKASGSATKDKGNEADKAISVLVNSIQNFEGVGDEVDDEIDDEIKEQKSFLATLEERKEIRNRVQRNRAILQRLEKARDGPGNMGNSAYYSDSDLFQAANDGDIENLILQLNCLLNIDITDADGRTLLMHTVHHNRLECAQLLITRKANVDHQSAIGATPLHEAAFHSDTKMIKLLLTSGANATQVDRGNRNVLHWATDNPNTECLKELLAQRRNLHLDINAIASDGMTPAMYAAYNNRPGHLKLLIESGADLDEKDVDGKTVYHWSVHRNHAHCLKATLSLPATYFRDILGRTVMHKVAESGGVDAYHTVYNVREDAIDDTDKQGRTPLIWAAASNNVPVLKELLEANAKLDVCDLDGKQALGYATELDNTTCVRLLQQAIAAQPQEQKRIIHTGRDAWC